MSVDEQTKVAEVLAELDEAIERTASNKDLSRTTVRTRLNCSLTVLVDKTHVFIIGQSHLGTPGHLYLSAPDKSFSADQALDVGSSHSGYEDPFLISLPKEVLEKVKNARHIDVESVSASFVESEVQRMVRKTSVIQMNPIFGLPAYVVDDQLALVLMPFDPELTKVYNTIIKPTVEEVRLVCRRADDYKTNKAIMQDIWKAICEARVVIADLTDCNPNVMYELGIAHTVGKETIIVYQKGRAKEFPFDLAHIRRIEYEDNAVGGKKLEEDLQSTLLTVLNPPVLS